MEGVLGVGGTATANRHSLHHVNSSSLDHPLHQALHDLLEAGGGGKGLVLVLPSQVVVEVRHLTAERLLDLVVALLLLLRALMSILLYLSTSWIGPLRCLC